MNIDFSKIKSECQTDSGLIKLVRNKFIPNTNLMSEIAQKEFEEKINDFSNIDTTLSKLLDIEYSIYLSKQNEINGRFIEFADKLSNSTDYPNVRAVIDQFKLNVKLQIDPTSILTGINHIITALADSNRQSRVSRSGSSLMHHISYLLQKRGFILERDFQREYILSQGCKLDFFFPNIETFNYDPINCCAVACQTTSNDRFRLTFAQVPERTRNRACTAIGSSNFGALGDPSSLTNNKLDEARSNGIKFVIFDNAIDNRLRSSKTVMSYEEWFKELNDIKGFWAVS
jgi:hypothetical protein